MDNPQLEESPSARMTRLHQKLNEFESEDLPKARLKVPEHLLDFSSSSSEDEHKESFLEYLKNVKQHWEEKEKE